VNRLTRFAVFSTVSAALLAGPVLAQDQRARPDDQHDQTADHRDQRYDQHNNHTYVEHKEWKKGYHMKHEDWDRGEHVDDWKAHHLRQPPRGYEWRQLDGNYVLGSINTGIISATIVAR
jgi:Ni/Co efflux regulator RcnB